ncbi:N-acyl-D-amino-acid deacylase family protein [Pectinatus haikarae]|uniref:N-acyl-D-amino-acid deacylase family protein n=1 Tax=Pectinatus haikarae TaxID=349096 RepID=UPI0018C7A9EA|nr:D-aminoacylase [Pectinatus haikarae]
MTIMLTNLKIFDGSGEKPFDGNIFIENDKIVKTGSFSAKADELIDCTGLCAAPGFIDTHSHSDLNVLIKPQLLPKIMQGITTEVLGQDGVSMAPLPVKYIDPWRKNLAGLDGDSNEVDWQYETAENYLKMIEKAQPSINECYLVPHGNVRMEAMGLINRAPNAEEMHRMKQILRRELEAGAYGLSTGLIYMPCAYAPTEELIELCKVAAEYDSVFVVHQRSEADTIIESMREIIEIGRKSGVRVHFSHFKVCGKKNWHYIDEMVKLLDAAQAEGIRVSFDQYPYVAGSTMLGVILPPWVHDGGTNKVLERLNDKTARQRMVHDIENGISGWDNFIDFAGMDNIYVTSVKTEKNKDAVGLSLTEFAKLRHKATYDAVFDLLYEEENAVGMVDFYGTEEHVKLFMQRPEMNACTDGLLGGKPHPRAFGAFPRVLGKYAREEKLMPMEKAIYKMTKKPAAALGIKKRGELKSGFYADIVIFDEKTIIDKGTFIEPVQYPAGVEYVFVNGCKMLEKGKYITAQKRCGRVLYR